jgi:uncharacterized membrane protein
MTVLLLGLVLFLGIHSVRIVAQAWRQRRIDAMGLNGWKAAYSLVSAVGLALIVWGYGLARAEPVVLWVPPKGMAHAASLLTLVAFVLLAAAYVPRNRIKSRLRHPMVLGVKVWALAHLLSNGNLADVLLFGSFLVWAVLSFKAARRRDESAPVSGGSADGNLPNTLVTVGIGVIAWGVFAFWAHGVLIGVRPFGG